MERDVRRKPTFLLRLPLSIRDVATRIAHKDGTSLNHFITLAVAEKLSRMKHTVHRDPDKTSSSNELGRAPH